MITKEPKQIMSLLGGPVHIQWYGPHKCGSPVGQGANPSGSTGFYQCCPVFRSIIEGTFGPDYESFLVFDGHSSVLVSLTIL